MQHYIQKLALQYFQAGSLPEIFLIGEFIAHTINLENLVNLRKKRYYENSLGFHIFQDSNREQSLKHNQVHTRQDDCHHRHGAQGHFVYDVHDKNGYLTIESIEG